MFNKDLKEKAIIVNLSISTWSARKTDKNVLKEISNIYNADQDHGSFSKLLISKNRLEEIKDIASSARKFHNEMTLPWMDGGGRLLPSKDFADYQLKIGEFKTNFYDAVQNFVTYYDEYTNEGLTKLGQIADTKDYPTKEAISDKYEFSYTYFPVPEDGDFRVTLSPEFVNSLKSNFSQSHQERFQKAKNSVVKDFIDLVSNAIRRLSNEDESAWFKSVTIDNIVTYREDHAMIELLEDQELFDLIDSCSRTASIYTVQELRANQNYRLFIVKEFKANLIKASESSTLITEPIEILNENHINSNISLNTSNIAQSSELSDIIQNFDDIVPSSIPDADNSKELNDNKQSDQSNSSDNESSELNENEQEGQSISDNPSNDNDITSLSSTDIIMNPFGFELNVSEESVPNDSHDNTVMNFFQINNSDHINEYFSDMNIIEDSKNIENNF